MSGFLASHAFVAKSFVAGILASVACGFGALPLKVPGLRVAERVGLGYAFAAGLMFAASVYNLLLPALTLHADHGVRPVVNTLAGILLGCGFLWLVGNRVLTPERLASRRFRSLGGRMETLVFLAMCFHSIPEGVAVGVGFTSESRLGGAHDLGTAIAIAIAVHNIPEGLAVALPMFSRGASMARCFWFAFLTSLPQPLAAVPSSLLVWVFRPLLVPSLGFAAGAMMYLVVSELLPEASAKHSRDAVAWAFMAGFGLMILVQVAL